MWRNIYTCLVCEMKFGLRRKGLTTCRLFMLQEVQEAKGPNRWHAAEGSEMSKSMGADPMIMNMQGTIISTARGSLSRTLALQKATLELTRSLEYITQQPALTGPLPQISLTKSYHLNMAIFQQPPSTQDPFNIFHFNASVINKLRHHLFGRIKNAFLL